MTVPVTTAELADDVRRKTGAKPSVTARVGPVADRAADRIRHDLGHIDQAVLAEVLLRAARAIGTELLVELRGAGIEADAYALMGVSAMAVIGEQFYRETP